MVTRLSRVRLLHGALKDEPIRPPWAIDESLFVDKCERCDKCIQACEYQTLTRGPGGFPIVDFSQSGCDFCGDCVRSCSHDVLKFPSDPHQPPWSVKAEILSQCISLHGTLCRTCGEACEENAIRFKLEVGGDRPTTSGHRKVQRLWRVLCRLPRQIHPVLPDVIK